MNHVQLVEGFSFCYSPSPARCYIWTVTVRRCVMLRAPGEDSGDYRLRPNDDSIMYGPVFKLLILPTALTGLTTKRQASVITGSEANLCRSLAGLHTRAIATHLRHSHATVRSPRGVVISNTIQLVPSNQTACNTHKVNRNEHKRLPFALASDRVRRRAPNELIGRQERRREPLPRAH